MTIFVDASAFVAIVVGEPDSASLSDILEADPDRLCSALSVWETVAALCRSYASPITAARATVDDFLRAGRFRYVGIGERELQLATEAYAQFGKGRHPAALNMGDCFAYACAKANRAKLLYKGYDFAKTDLG